MKEKKPAIWRISVKTDNDGGVKVAEGRLEESALKQWNPIGLDEKHNAMFCLCLERQAVIFCHPEEGKITDFLKDPCNPVNLGWAFKALKKARKRPVSLSRKKTLDELRQLQRIRRLENMGTAEAQEMIDRLLKHNPDLQKHRIL